MNDERRVTTYLDLLRASAVLEPERLEELERRPEAVNADPKALPRYVLQRGWLTRWQLNMVAQGRGKELTISSYRLLDRLGEGGMGTVYKAHHLVMNRTVALKVIRKEKLANPTSVKRFYREVQAAAQLVDPNIVMAYDAGQTGATHFFAMEYVEGIDLARFVKQSGPLPVAQACDFVRQAGLGLQHAFERGLVHRDIKPANLLLSRSVLNPSSTSDTGSGDARGTKTIVKILDMGLALDASEDHSMTKDGAVLGTPEYLAPEQALNSHSADTRSDLYSLGCTFYYLLTGKPPFSADTLAELLLKHQMLPPAPLSSVRKDVPASVQAVVDRLLAKRPEERFQQPAALVAVLEPLCQDGGLNGVPYVLQEVIHPPTSNRPMSLGDFDFNSQMTAPISGVQSPAVPASPTKTVPASAATATADPESKFSAVWSRVTSARPATLFAVGGAGVVTVLGAALLVLTFFHKKPVEKPADDGTKPVAEAFVRLEVPSTARTEAPVLLPPRVDPQPQVVPRPQPQVPPVPLPSQVPPVVPGPGGLHIPPAIVARLPPRVPGQPGALNLNPTQIPENLRLPGINELVAVCKDHSDQVWTLDFSPDGAWLATGSKDGTMRLWLLGNQSQPARSQVVNARQGGVGALSWSADNRLLAFGSLDDTVQLGGIGLGGQLLSELPALQGHTQSMDTVAFAPVGRLLAVCHNADVCIWDLRGPDAKEFGRLGGHVGSVRCIAFSNDCTLLASGGSDNLIKLWRLTGATYVDAGTLNPLVSHPNSLSFSPDGKTLAAGLNNGSVHLWDLSGPTPRERPTIKAHRGWVTGIRFAPDGQTFVTSSHDSHGSWWNLDGSKRQDWLFPTRLSRVAFNPDGRHVAFAGHDGAAYVLRLTPGEATAVRPRGPTETPVVAVEPKVERVPVPEAADLAKAETVIKDLFKEEYAKRKVADLLALSAKLFQQAQESKDDAVSRFVLLREARELAVQAGDAASALRAVDEMAAHFVVDPLDLKVAALTAIAKGATTVAAVRTALEQIFVLVDQAVAADHYDAAQKLAAQAEAAARKATAAPALVALVESRTKALRDLQKEFTDLKPSTEKLAAKPDDPEANLALGSFLCFRKGEWDKGLPHLSAGGDEAIKTVAVKELAQPTEAVEQMELGDAWWDRAEAERGPNKGPMQRRAYHWYEVAAPNSTGLALVKIDKRMKQLEQLPDFKKQETVGLVRKLTGSGDWLLSAAFAPDGRKALTGGRDGVLRVWEVETGKELSRLPNAVGGEVRCLTYSPDGRRAIASLGDGGLCAVFDMERGGILTNSMGFGSQITGLTTLADNRKVVFGAGFSLWTLTLEGVSSVPHGGGWGNISASTASADGRLGVVGSSEGGIVLYDFDARRIVSRLPGHTGKVVALAIAPDSRWLVSSGADKLVKTWDLKTGLESRRLKGHTGLVPALVFTRDGKRLLSGGEDGSVRLWDPRLARQLMLFTGHEGPVNAVAVSADGRRALSGSSDKTARLWNLPR